MKTFIQKLFDNNEKQVTKMQPLVARINALEPEFAKLKDMDLAKKTAEFKQRYADGESLDDLLPEAFANVREAAKRSVGMRHFDVQLVGGIVLHQGKIAEMKTGEGKTLVATLPLYLNALAGEGAHLVTVNGFLAQMGMGWNGPIYHLLGLSVAAIDHDLSVVYDPEFTNEAHEDERLRHLRPVSRREAYAADITYGTNNEYGFDYLRDNMVQDLSQMSQRPLFYAIVDEVDSILIDEARTPLIISAPAEESNELYVRFAKLVKQLGGDDYALDEKTKSVSLTESGADKMDRWLGVENVYDDFTLTHHLDQALRATYAYMLDKDYVVQSGEVVIVDEFTGRLMPGRRYSEGLHQAIEAKEGVEIQKETRTLATITFQNYFRLYEKLAGMTGTAETEAEEFAKIYKLDVVVIPTNKPMVREDLPDLVYKNQHAKYEAVVADILEKHEKGQPVLVGTTSVEKNEMLSALLTKYRVPHELLNAKNHEGEADIVSRAGQKGAVTVATNMAGRGTDIRLGEGVTALGGLYVVGTERHESRRIDNQLRGRAGRQGDPGVSRFFVALDDDLMRLFGGERIAGLMERFNLPDDVPIENPMVSRSIESAQVKVEGHNFDMRKHVVEYDDVINKQREIIYARRRAVLEGIAAAKGGDGTIRQLAEHDGTDESEILSEPSSRQPRSNRGQSVNPDQIGVKPSVFDVQEYIDGLLQSAAQTAVAMGQAEHELDIDLILEEVSSVLPFDGTSKAGLKQRLVELEHEGDLVAVVEDLFVQARTQRVEQLGAEMARYIDQMVVLEAMDRLWMEHIDTVDELRDGVRLRGYGQRDPLVEFKNEAYKLFEQLMERIDYEIVHAIFKVQIVQQPVDMLAGAQESKQELPVGSVEAAVEAGVLDPEMALPVNAAVTPLAALPQLRSGAFTPRQQLNVSGTMPVDYSKVGRNDPCPCGSGLKYKRCGLIGAPEHRG